MPTPSPILDDLERRTKEVARRHGCDRAVFTVCWGELEQGLTCRCKEDAREELQREAALCQEAADV